MAPTTAPQVDATSEETRTASQPIADEVTSWLGIEARPGRRGEFVFRLGRREIGHFDGDHAARFGSPRARWWELIAEGRIGPPGVPERATPSGPADRERSRHSGIALMRLNYNRLAKAELSTTAARVQR